MGENDRILGDQPPQDYEEHTHTQDAGETKQEVEPLVAEPSARPQRRRTFEIPKIKLPKRNRQDKKDDIIMRLYGNAGLIVLLRTAIAIAVVGITGAMFSRKVHGGPAVAVAFSMAVVSIRPFCIARIGFNC